MREFKAGDKAVVVKLKFKHYPERKIGDIVTITGVESKGYSTEVNWFNKCELDEIKQFTLSDIKERWLVVFANGKEGVFDGEEFKVIENGKYTIDGRNVMYYDEDLTHANNKAWTIVKVLKPRYEEIWTRPEEENKKPEYTMEQLVEKLGDFKLVKGDK